MTFKHLMAFGNSDQVSFRNVAVQRSFDVMTVPGTIASYYQDATAAFVLSSQLDYLIDPRSPLFQGSVSEPRASHLTLAEWHGAAVLRAVSAGGAVLEPEFYDSAVVSEMVNEVVLRQRNYSGRAPAVKKKLDRYAALLAEAMQQQGATPPTRSARPPYAVLAPYFAVNGTSDPWWDVMERIWEAAANLGDPDQIVPVLCLDGRQKENADGVAALGATLDHLPDQLSMATFFWITNFDERKVELPQLQGLWDTVRGAPDGRRLVNMYGGYFSICMRHAGLRGFGNGLTYSESRDWPALASTGAAPPRYYVRDLHLFVPPAVAATLEVADESFSCPCSSCAEWRATGQSLASMPYHDLKRHFALARRWELDRTASTEPGDLAEQLDEALGRGLRAKSANLVLEALPALEYLGRWAQVLRAH